MAGLPLHVWLLLVGDGPERRDLEVQAQRLGLAGRVVFAGEQDHAHVIDTLFASDLFVFPSQTETLGLAVLEAMAAGRAVVAVQGGAIPEIVRDGETGRVVPADPAALRQAIAVLAGDAELRRTMGARAAAVSAAYSQARVVDRLLENYTEMVGRDAPTRTTA
jgi:glycosyltransferase involved in cell wall biosynthesis